MPVKPKKGRAQATLYLPEELADMVDAAEGMWRFRSKAEFFEIAIRNQLAMELMTGKAMQKRIAKALNAHLRAIEEI
jgi:hypothetical protein